MKEERFHPSELQIKILEKLLQGTTDAAIGRALRIADRTVRLHISKLQSHLCVRGRFALGAVAHANGWIDLNHSAPSKECG
jgi:DNA-binding NarL/FixJ family response regulator